MQIAPTSVSRDRAVERLRGLITGVAMAGFAGMVGFGYLAATSIPGRTEPTVGSPSGMTSSTNGSLGNVPIAGAPQTKRSVRRHHRDDGQTGSIQPPTVQSAPVPYFQAPVQNPFSVGQGQVTTGGS